jgi:hypothetical protein
LQRIRDILWNVHEAKIEDTLTRKKITLQTNLAEYQCQRISRYSQTALIGRSQENNSVITAAHQVKVKDKIDVQLAEEWLEREVQKIGMTSK